jgi:hypothetical protein
MARTTTTAGGTKRAKGAGKSSAGSRKASTRSTKPSRQLRVRAYGPSDHSSINILLQSLTDDLLRQRSAIMRGIYDVPFGPGVATVRLTKSEQAMLRSFYSDVLKAAQRLLRTGKWRVFLPSTTSECGPANA